MFRLRDGAAAPDRAARGRDARRRRRRHRRPVRRRLEESHVALTSARSPRSSTPTRAGADPPYDHYDYVGTRLRAPKEPLVVIPATLTELTGPAYGDSCDRRARRRPHAAARGRAARRADRRQRPRPRERRQAAPRAAGRDLAGQRRRAAIAHDVDTHDAPLDPNFSGAGRCLTDDDGRYRFVTVKPGAYPWGNHPNAWRPNHIHFSLFGRAFTERLVTQMYFPGDPLFPFDPIFNSVRDPKGARAARLRPSTSG